MNEKLVRCIQNLFGLKNRKILVSLTYKSKYETDMNKIENNELKYGLDAAPW